MSCNWNNRTMNDVSLNPNLNIEYNFNIKPQHHAQLGLPDKGHVIKGLVVCNNKDLEPLVWS